MAIKIQDYATKVQMKQIGRLLRQSLLDWKMEKMEEKSKMCRELILLCWTRNLSEFQVLWPTMVGTVENKIKKE
jgi:hypothetical protein